MTALQAATSGGSAPLSWLLLSPTVLRLVQPLTALGRAPLNALPPSCTVCTAVQEDTAAGREPLRELPLKSLHGGGGWRGTRECWWVMVAGPHTHQNGDRRGVD